MCADRLRGETAWLMAKANREKLVEELSPEMQYAIRRVGGFDRLDTRKIEFQQAWNESPVVDADLDTKNSPAKILVRAHEPKDGVR